MLKTEVMAICEKKGLKIPKKLNGLLFVSDKMQAKMNGMLAISTSSLCNKFCEKMSQNEHAICSKCYGRQGEKWKRNVGPNYIYNGEILSTVDFENHEEYIPVFMSRDVVRFNADGELINSLHFKNILTIAKANPDTAFALWTKRDKLVQNYLNKIGGWCAVPTNLQMVYSEPLLNVCNKNTPKYFDRRFIVCTADYALQHNIRITCGTKQCKDCMQCYRQAIPLHDTDLVCEILKSDTKKFLKNGGIIF